MYRPAGGVEGATELIVAKNRNGTTGFVDLYFYHEWLRSRIWSNRGDNPSY
jgi:replicative DNA helicase